MKDCDFTICITTHERPDCLHRCLTSIAQHNRDARVLVGDDGATPTYVDPRHATRIALPANAGLSANRNALFDACETEYLILFEDDFVVAADTHLDLLVTFVRKGMFDVAGGATRTPAGIVHFEGYLRPNGSTLRLKPLAQLHFRPMQVRCCDITANFVAMRAATARRIRCDESLPLGEHYEFFLRCSEATPLVRVGYAPMCVIDHVRDRPGRYKIEREQKQHDGHAQFLANRGYTNITGSLSE